MIPDARENSNQRRTVAYTCGHSFEFIGNVVIDGACPRCGAPMVGRT